MVNKVSLTWKQSFKKFKFLILAVASLIYMYFIPSAVYYYNYSPLEEIDKDLLTVAYNKDARLPLCPLITSKLDKWMFGDSYFPDREYLELIKLKNDSSKSMESGGNWKPNWCTARYKVAIIVPYRNREEQLQLFLAHMHYFLKFQLIDYTILVIEQVDNLPFNRGALLNVGYLEALKINPNFQCFIFHDVDLLPVNGANLYACSRMPRHMSVSVNTFRFNLPFISLFGGVVAMTLEQFRTVNGFSNKFYGWGGEDDDMSRRIIKNGYEISRWSPRISRYYMLPHSKEVPNRDRYQILREGKNKFHEEGLNNLQYVVKQTNSQKFCTFISVDFR